MSNYYPNRDMLWSGFPTNWTLLKRLMWVRIMRGGSVSPVYETITGNPVSFETVRPYKLRQLEVAFSPVQDLHGYDAPWPAGGGKNKLNVPQSVSLSGAGFLVPSNTGINLPAGTYTLSFSASSVASGARFQIILSFGSTDVFSRTDSIIASTSITFTTEQDADTIRIFCNNSNACVYTNAMIESGSTATSYAPYSNICPISGWDSLNVEQRGVNIFDDELELGSLNSDGQETASTNRLRSKNYIPILGGKRYWTNLDYGTGCCYDANKNYIGTMPCAYGPSAGTYYIDPPTNTRYWRFSLPASYGTVNKHDITINYPSTDHDYHAYNPSSRSISISLGSTVYGGTLDVLTGVVTVTWAKKTLNGSEVWSGTPNSGWYTQENSLKKLTSYVGHMMADTLLAGAIRENWLYGYTDINNRYPGENWIYYRNSDMASEAEVDAFFTANPTEVVYDLATPTTIQLTPQEVQSLAGDNTMWTDGDSLTVEYRSN